jgi:hypothetical protein
LGCGREPPTDEVISVRMHTLANCAPHSETLEHGTAQLSALGDFPPSNDSAQVLSLGDVGAQLRFPAATRAVLAQVNGGSSGFSGYSERRASTDLDVLLWPDGMSCEVVPERRATYPGRPGGQALGYSNESGLVLIAGGNDAKNSDAIVGALTFDTATAHTALLRADAAGALREPRAYSSVTAFGDGFLVAGGEHPVAGVDELELDLHADAEIFDPAQQGFSGERISAVEARWAASTSRNISSNSWTRRPAAPCSAAPWSRASTRSSCA